MRVKLSSMRDMPPLAQMLERLERVLAGSPAAVTEISWTEIRGGQESTGKRPHDPIERCGSSVLVRVRESCRTGLHHTGDTEPSDLENALRSALAQARLAPVSPEAVIASAGETVIASAGEPAPELALFDAELAELTPQRACEHLAHLADRGEPARLTWAEERVAVVNSAGLRRSARATVATLSVSCGRGAGAGSAAAAARSVAALAPARVVERARSRHAGAAGAQTPLTPAPAPFVLSPEAAAALLDALNRHALSSASFRAGTSPLCGCLGAPALAPSLGLRDDGTDLRGLPFPFDLFGWTKRPVDLVSGGVLLSPAIDPSLAASLGRAATPHQVAPEEAFATNLFLLPGSRPDEELLREAEGGLWIGSLRTLQCYDPPRLRFRALAQGVRRLAGGGLGEPQPDFVWEDTLTGAFSRLLAIGSETVSVAMGDGFLGAVTVPLLALRPDRV